MKSNLGCEFTNSTNPAEGMELPFDFELYVSTMVCLICQQGYEARTFKGTTPNGAAVFLIGSGSRSRALAVHADDRPGLVHILLDDGQPINMRKPAIAAKAVWLSDLIGGENGYLTIEDKLELKNPKYWNRRLESTRKNY